MRLTKRRLCNASAIEHDIISDETTISMHLTEIRDLLKQILAKIKD
jgi:hypothetical protein